MQILQSNVRQRRRTLQKVMQKSIDNAHEPLGREARSVMPCRSVMLTTAYFFPPSFLKGALLWPGPRECPKKS